MKILSALMLALLLTGCASAEPVETREPAAVTEAAVTESTAAETTAPETTVPETTEYPETIEFPVPGTEKTMVLEAFDGGSYVIYIPQEDWTLETTLENGYLTDCWTNVHSEHTRLKVIHYGDLSAETVEKLLLATETAYHFAAPDHGYIGGTDPVYGLHMGFEIASGDSGTYVLMAEYYLSGESTYRPVIRAMMDSFLLK